MTVSKILSIISLIVLGAIILYMISFFWIFYERSKNISKYEPFKEWIGQTVTLNRETLLFYEKNDKYKNKKYPFSLVDTLHPRWDYDYYNYNEQMEIITRFPAGTKLRIECAKIYKSQNTGYSSPYVYGTIILNNGMEYKIGYTWGEEVREYYPSNNKDKWNFHLAPWQDTLDTTMYKLF